MAVLGIKEVVRRIQEEDLITGLGGRDLSNPEGTGIDLRLGAVHEIVSSDAYIEADSDAQTGKRKGVETQEVCSLEKDDIGKDLVLKPGEYYLVQTAETINTPMDLMPVIYPRGSLLRAGVLLVSSKTDPGYKGPLTFGITNLGQFDFRLQLGARFCNIVFYLIEGETIAYRGQHQGGRFGFGEEQQV